MAKLKITTPRGAIFQTTGKNGRTKAVLEWNPGFGAQYTGRFTTAQKYVDSEVLRYSDPYTPRDTGMLILSGKLGTVIGSGEVEYLAPYARRLYYGKDMRFRGAPMRGALWFERMKVDHRAAILRGAEQIAKGGR